MSPLGGPREDYGWQHGACVHSFDDMGLPDNLLRGVYAYGFETPSPVQQRLIPFLLGPMPCDVVVSSRSGMGKTVGFTIGMLGRIDVSVPRPQALVLCPTRELAHQTERVIAGLGCYLRLDDSPFTVTLIGGTRSVRADASVCIGTPGRVSDLIERGAFDVRGLRLVVVDEADEVLSMAPGRAVLKGIPRGVPKVICGTSLAMASPFLRPSPRLLLGAGGGLSVGTRHHLLVVAKEHQIATLVDVVAHLAPAHSALLFTNSNQRAEELASILPGVRAFHTDLMQQERDAILDSFRSGSCRVLVATDVISIGIDVPSCRLVDIPNTVERYLHRAGRCGRYGQRGVVVTMAGEDGDASHLVDAVGMDAMPANFAMHVM